MRSVAIDSDPIALDIIEEFCLRLGLPDLVKFTDPAAGFGFAANSRPDIVFLDISESCRCGLQIAAGLPPECCVIFTSASIDYAAAGFNLDIVDYLLKPFSFERFKRAVSKAERRMNFNAFLKGQKTIIVKQEYNNIPVAIDDILYVEAMENYSKIHTKSGKTVLTHTSLKNLLSLLHDSGFIRIHKSFMVPVGEIESFNRRSVCLHGDINLPVGRRFAPALIRYFS